MTAAGWRRRLIVLLGVIGLTSGLLTLFADPAQADVTGGCDGSIDFSSDIVGAYTPANDTRGNPIIVPKEIGNMVRWEGSVPAANTNFEGEVEIRIGPAWVEVADWGFPDHDGTNADDVRIDSGTYRMRDFWDVVPRDLVHGLYEARAVHSAAGVDCEAHVFVKFEGNAFESPVAIAGIVLLLVFLFLLVFAGRQRLGAVGFFSGRPIVAVLAAVFLGLMIALLLQQFCVWPLDPVSVIYLPLALILIGLVIAKFAPFGGASPGVAEVARRQAVRAAEEKKRS